MLNRIKCFQCRAWCGAKITSVTPRLRAPGHGVDLCRQCAEARVSPPEPVQKLHIGTHLFTWQGGKPGVPP
jgi:hypothetical protein